MLQVHLNDDPGQPDEELQWLISDYKSGSWEGSGSAVGFDGVDLLLYNLGHCSCYGPFDGGFNGYGPDKISVERYKETRHDALCEVEDKFHEFVDKQLGLV